MENQIDENDVYERKDTVIISVKFLSPVDKDELCATLTCKLIKDHLNYDIFVIHRLGEKKTTQGSDRRDIIVRFCRRNTKMDVLSAPRRKDKGCELLCK